MMSRRGVLSIAVAAVLTAGCGHAQFVPTQPQLSLPAPTPAGMEEMAPQAATPAPTQEDCNRTASMRPFADKAQADAAVTNIRARGRLT